jgi:hypothetical protein
MWQEARDNVLRQALDDVMMRLEGANFYAKRAFYVSVDTTIEDLRDAYRAGSSSERKAILKGFREPMNRMWDRGDGYWALGLTVCGMNVESEHLPGDDAAYVKKETDKIIAEASVFLKNNPRY